MAAYNPEPNRTHLTVLIELAAGLTQAEIGTKFGLTASTVQRKVEILIRKLDLLSIEQELFTGHSGLLRLRGQARFEAYADLAVDLKLLVYGSQGAYQLHPRTILSPTQREILTWLASGYTMAEAAGGVGLSEHSVRSAVIRIREILGTNNTVHSAVVAISLGVIKIAEIAPVSQLEIS